MASARFGGKGVWRMKNVKVSGMLGGDSSQVIGYGACAAPLSQCIMSNIDCSIDGGECGIGIVC